MAVLVPYDGSDPAQAAVEEAVSVYDLVDLEIEEAPLEDVFMRFYGGQGDA